MTHAVDVDHTVDYDFDNTAFRRQLPKIVIRLSLDTRFQVHTDLNDLNQFDKTYDWNYVEDL